MDSEKGNKYNNFYSNYFNEDTIKERKINSSNETPKYFLSEFTIFDKAERNIFDCLKNINYMFSGCSLLISLPDISKWNTYNNSIYMKSIFSRCSSLIYRNPHVY